MAHGVINCSYASYIVATTKLGGDVLCIKGIKMGLTLELAFLMQIMAPHLTLMLHVCR